MHVTTDGRGLVPGGMDALPPFRLYRPTSLAELQRLVPSLDGDLTWAHGTTDLVTQFRHGLEPTNVVSLRRVTELNVIRQEPRGLWLGAGITHLRASQDPAVAAFLPALQAHWARVATPRIRFRATLGGNLMARRNRYELVLLLGVLAAVAQLWTTEGEFDLPVARLAEADLAQGLLTGVAVPRREWRLAYHRRLRPLVTVAVGRSEAMTTVAVGSAAAPPWFLSTEGKSPRQVGREVAEALPADRQFGPEASVCRKILEAVTSDTVTQVEGGERV